MLYFVCNKLQKGDYKMIQKLIEGIIKKDAPVVVGLDPNLSFIPGFILTEAEAAAEGDIPPYCEKENVIAAKRSFSLTKRSRTLCATWCPPSNRR